MAEKMNVKFHGITSAYTWNFPNFKCVITILVKFDIHSLGLLCYYRWFITSSALEKCKKRMQNSLNYSVFLVFVHWKLKLVNFLVDSVLNYRYAYAEIHFHPWFILFKKEKIFHIKTKENLQQNTEFPRTCSPHCSWRFVCCVQGVVFVCSL